ncbi:MAG TPA: transposase, partial [Firmicutes bacterium]|nr:transposase [Bacillota bacterium]
MPRVARRLSSSGIYHVMVRGINKQDIFLEYQDYRQYLTVMRRIKERSNCIVH